MNVLVYQNTVDIIKANAINTINIAKGFTQNNCKVYFYVSKEEYFSFFDRNLKLVEFIVEKSYDEIINITKVNNIEIIYCRDLNFTEFLLTSSYNGYIILEDHDENLPPFIENARNHPKFILTTISSIIIDKYKTLNHVLFPCAIDVDYFSDSEQFDNSLFDKSKINVTYCGHLYDYKGIPLILEIAKRYPDVNFNLVGGKQRDINNNKNKATSNVYFYGHQEYFKIPSYLYSSDLLLIPYDKRGNEWSRSYVTSPIKLFEYLSTKKPVMCSDIVGIKNWVTNKEVIFYRANDINDFCQKFNWIINNINSNEIKEKCKNGLYLANKYSTKNKCKELLEKVKSLKDNAKEITKKL